MFVIFVLRFPYKTIPFMSVGGSNVMEKARQKAEIMRRCETFQKFCVGIRLFFSTKA